MRRIAVLLALYGACCGATAIAAPFDDLTQQLQDYDRQQPAPNKRSAHDSFANRDSDGSRETYASYNQQVPSEPVPAAQYQPQPANNDPILQQPDGDFLEGACGSCAACGGNACDCGCGPCHAWWGRAEYLMFWVRGMNTPPLVTTSPTNTPANEAGILPIAATLFGGQQINSNNRSGGRFSLGYFLNDCATLSIEDTFFFLGTAKDSFHASSNGSPILARPFLNTQTGVEDAVLLSFPNTIVGSINVTTSSQILGNEINLRRALVMNPINRLDFLAGYRFFYVNESLRVDTSSTAIGGGGIPVGTNFTIFDSFATQNVFNGGQFGLNWQHFFGRWSFDVLTKVALGANQQRVTINGQTTVASPGQGTTTSSGGILALGSNIGQYTRNQFSVLPELGLNLHYQFNDWWRLNVGYTLMFLTNVVRPGDQIDRRVDPNQFPPPVSAGTFPQFSFHDTDIWLQGWNLGLEFTF